MSDTHHRANKNHITCKPISAAGDIRHPLEFDHLTILALNYSGYPNLHLNLLH
jgi:hypothetical protein